MADLNREMELRRQREINDVDRYGTPNGCHSIHGTVTQYRDGSPVSTWSSSSDTTKSFTSRDDATYVSLPPWLR